MEQNTAEKRLLNFKNALDTIPLDGVIQCSYFADRLSQSRSFRVQGDIPLDFFEAALNKGYRRCGDIYYQFDCPGCMLCQSYRVVVSEFIPSRSQKRVIRRNSDVSSRFIQPTITPIKENIYLRYQEQQHSQSNVDNLGKSNDSNELLKTMYYQMYTNPTQTREIEFYLNRTLIGFGVLDIAVESVSAVYCVFDPDFGKRSLGTLSILRGIEWARENDFKYYHLGFFIPEHPKMDYKMNFQKGEILNRSSTFWETVSTR